MAEAPETTQAATSPTAQSWSSRGRRCLHHLPRPIERPSRRAVYGAGSNRRVKKGGSKKPPRTRSSGATPSIRQLARQLASEAQDAGELVGPVHHEGGEARLLGPHALARGAQHETGRDHAVPVEDRRRDARRALGDLVQGDGEPSAPDLVEHAA